MSILADKELQNLWSYLQRFKTWEDIEPAILCMSPEELAIFNAKLNLSIFLKVVSIEQLLKELTNAPHG